MELYRTCPEDEVYMMLDDRDVQCTGKLFCYLKNMPNNHVYEIDVPYLHFFERYEDIFYWRSHFTYVCVFEVPDDVLVGRKGIGRYASLTGIKEDSPVEIEEYAIPSQFISFDMLKRIDLIDWTLSQQAYLHGRTGDCITTIYKKEGPYLHRKFKVFGERWRFEDEK